MKKPFYKCWWFWATISVAFLLCVGNIVLAHLKKDSSGANIFTAVSGWVSGIATAILGVIAVVQNRKYKEENDRVLERESEENRKYIDEQKDLAWRNAQYQLFGFYVTTLNNIRNSLSENYFSVIHNDLVALPANEQTYTQIIYKKNLLKSKLKSIKDFLLQSQYFLADKDKLFDLTSMHLEKVNKYFEFITDNKFMAVSQALKTNNDSALKKTVMEYGNEAYSTWVNFSEELICHINRLYELISELHYENLNELQEKISASKSEYEVWKNKTYNSQQEAQNNR